MSNTLPASCLSRSVKHLIMPASRKQEIYKEKMFISLPYIRNVQTWPWWHRLRDRTCYYEAELIHNLCYSILIPQFVAHDIHFLNYQARIYFDNCQKSANYAGHVDRIGELFKLVPEPMRSELKWSGPP